MKRQLSYPSVSLQMLSDLNSLLDQHVKILRDLRSQTVLLQDAKDLATSNALDLSDAVGVTKHHTNLGWGKPLLGELANMALDVSGGNLQPGRRAALVRAGALRDALSTAVHTTHDSSCSFFQLDEPVKKS